MKLKINKKGFTLIELLIVIVIIGVLALALLPTILEGPAKARDAARLANMIKIRDAYYKYIIIDGNEPPAEFFDGSGVSNAEDFLADILSIFPGNNTAFSNQENYFASVLNLNTAYAGEVTPAVTCSDYNNTNESTCTANGRNSCEWDKSKLTCSDSVVVVIGGSCGDNSYTDENTCTDDGKNNCEWDKSKLTCGDQGTVKQPGSNGHFAITPALVNNPNSPSDPVFIIGGKVESKDGNITCAGLNDLGNHCQTVNGKTYCQEPDLAESSDNDCFVMEIKIRPDVMSSSVEEGAMNCEDIATECVYNGFTLTQCNSQCPDAQSPTCSDVCE